MNKIICDIDVNHVEEKVQHGALLLDVRSYEEFDEGTISGSILIPHDEVPTRIKEIEAAVTAKGATEIIVFCRSGRRSELVANYLRSLGYENVFNGGAYELLCGNAVRL